MDKKHKYSKYKSKPSSNDSQTNRGITPVIDVADSSDDRYSKRSISSNWRENESPEDDENDELIDDDNEQMNFQSLQKASYGSHFTFSSEKQWETEKPLSEITSDYFTINLKLLKGGLSTIPFYKRMEYDPSLFTNEQLKQMNDEGERNEKEYQNILKNYEKNKHKASTSIKTNNNDVLDEISSTNSKIIEILKDEKTATENLPIGNEKSEKSDNPAQDDKKENIQEWLDGILDE